MKVIKLDAIDSTNDFKGLSNKQELENFTIVLQKIKLMGRDKWDQYGTLRW
jgi:hypothetical protein